jgi:hypothetical protein
MPVRGWWAWWLGSGLVAFGLFFVCASCNPATTATDRALARLQALMAEHLGNELHPLLSAYVTPFINSYLALPYAQMSVVGIGFAFTVRDARPSAFPHRRGAGRVASDLGELRPAPRRV